MIKELQKQIEEKKRELIRPVKEEFEQIFQGFRIEVELDTENLSASMAAVRNENGNFAQLSFLAAGEERNYGSISFKQISEEGIVTSIKPTPFSIDTTVINYVFYKLIELLNQIAPTEEVEEAAPAE